MLARAVTTNAARLEAVPVVRGYATVGADIPLPNIPASRGVGSVDTSGHVSELGNGVRVASIESASPVAAVGVFVGAGTRHETGVTSGAAHFSKALAFKSTTNRSHFRAVRELEHSGAVAYATHGREHSAVVASVLAGASTSGVAVDVLTDGVVNARVTPHEIFLSRSLVSHEVGAAAADAVAALDDLTHAAAYNADGLGRSLYCLPSDVNSVKANSVVQWREENFTPKNIVVAGVGFSHSDLVAMVEGSALSVFENDAKRKVAKSVYTGGETRVQASGPLTHVCLAYEGANRDNAAALNALQVILGSYKAGYVSPGSGVLSSGLYNAFASGSGAKLNAAAVSSFACSHSDGGLVGLRVSAPSVTIGESVKVARGVVAETAGKIGADDLARAKAVLKADYLNALLSRDAAVNDLGRQVLDTGKWTSSSAVVAAIDGLTVAAVQDAAKKALSSKLTLVAHGDTRRVPSYAALSSL